MSDRFATSRYASVVQGTNHVPSANDDERRERPQTEPTDRDDHEAPAADQAEADIDAYIEQVSRLIPRPGSDGKGGAEAD